VTKEEMGKLHAKERLLQNILKLVADNSDFLVEQKLSELLGSHTDDEKMLIKIDSVFTVSSRRCQLYFPLYSFVMKTSKAKISRSCNTLIYLHTKLITFKILEN
jgi:hypothetical protein